MDVVSLIVGTLAAGATAALKNIGGDLVKAGYEKLKSAVISKTSRKAAVESLQEDPHSGPQRQVIEDALNKSGAKEDTQLAQLAAELNELLAKLDPKLISSAGIDIKELEANNVTLRRITAAGGGVVGEKWKLKGDLTIEDVRAGEPSPKK